MEIILGSVLLNLFLCSFTSGYVVNPDSKKIYHDITAGRGLYSGFDKITNLNATNFKATIFNNSKSHAWMVEFYNSWCGHCHRFSPVWKQYAVDIYNWKDVIGVSAVDCSNPLNTPLCRDYEIMYYPFVKYFPASPPADFLGSPLKVGSVEHLIHKTLGILRQDMQEESFQGTEKHHLLSPFTDNFINLWSNVNKDVKFVIAVVQNNNTFLGEALALDFLKIHSVNVAIVFNDNHDVVNSLGTTKFPSVYLIDRNNIITPIISSDNDRFSIYASIKKALAERGFEIPSLTREIIPTDITVDVSQVMALMEVEEQIKKKLNLNALSDVVFQIDLEGALRHSFRVEVSSHKTVEGESLAALKSFIATLVDFFPFGKKGMDYMNSIQNELIGKDRISGSDFMSIVARNEEVHKPYLRPKSGWLGCRGSQLRFRGYPCSLWTLFHTLTVHADAARETNGMRVLHAMHGYIKHFFGCTDCSQHFQEMAKTAAGNVSTTEDGILWLWKAHNSVNKRLKGDQTEDPNHPKVQFPPQELCRACRFANGSWNEQIVLPFLKAMYTNISYFTIDEITTTSTTPKTIAAKMLRHDNIVDFKPEKTQNYSHIESKPILFNFNVFDLSMFFVLYLVSMAIIILVFIKFLAKKSFRKKCYIPDIFHKV